MSHSNNYQNETIEVFTFMTEIFWFRGEQRQMKLYTKLFALSNLPSSIAPVFYSVGENKKFMIWFHFSTIGFSQEFQIILGKLNKCQMQIFIHICLNNPPLILQNASTKH